MARQEVLLLAMTKMRSGICTAGFTSDPSPASGLQWVRPVRDFGSLLPGDMVDPDGHLFCCCDVVELDLIAPRAKPPHVEDWLTDFVHHRPRLLRRLEGKKRAQFLARHLDRAPDDVLRRHTRSLCLVHPERLWGSFVLDEYSGKFAAHLGFALPTSGKVAYSTPARGITVTDLKWRALGRRWLAGRGGSLRIDDDSLRERLQAEAIYLSLGLSRSWQGQHWLLVVGVHVVPDYEIQIDAGLL
jgi:hypothetical protein